MKIINRLMASALVAAFCAMPAYASESLQAVETAIPAVMAPSLYQWKAMASAEASALAQKLGNESGPWLVKAADSNDSRFARSFTTMLVSELTARGIQLTTLDTATSVIELKVESNPIHSEWAYKPGTLTLVTLGLWLVKGLTEVTTPAGVVTALAFGTDVLLSEREGKADTPAAELAVTLIAAKKGSVAASNTSLYLLNKNGQGSYAYLPGHILKFAK